MTEAHMVAAASEYLERAGIEAVVGVPFMSRCIDLLIVRGEDDITAVEFKKHDWRRGIHQAKHHLLGANAAYVCVSLQQPSPACLKAANEAGVGLMRFNQVAECPLEELVEARPSGFIWPPARQWLLRGIKYVKEVPRL
jgi:hypothetical protein